MAVATTQINDLTPGSDIEIIRTYPLDESVTITSATLAIKSRIVTPTNVNGPGTLVPIFLTITNSQGTSGIISDSGASSNNCVLTFLISGSVSAAALAGATMYFFAISLTGTQNGTNAPQTYTPETGTITTQSNFS